MNQVALAFWVFCGLIGYLIGDTHGAVIGVTFGIGVSVLSSMTS